MNLTNSILRKRKSGAGFTLIEVLVYLAIVSGVLIMASTFAWNVIGGKAKSQSVQEVEANGRLIMERLVKEIRQASDINASSSFNTNLVLNSNLKLSLVMKDASLNPTEFFVVNSTLMINQGPGPSPIKYALSSNQVKISDLTFQNLSTVNAKTKNIKINLIIDHFNPDNRPEYTATVSLETTVELRDR